jgi:uncharacterized alkaline shock family protein YloU
VTSVDDTAWPARDTPGSLVLAPRAVERMTARLLSEVDGVGGVARRVLGVAVEAGRSDREPDVGADISGSTVRLRARVSVEYPNPVVRTAAAAQAHVADRVAALTGLVVTRVDITVSSLSADAPAAPRVV